MNRQDVLTAARLALELVLGLLGSQAAFATDADVPPALNCELVMPAQAARREPAAGASPTPVTSARDVRGGFEIVYPELVCRVATAEARTLGPASIASCGMPGSASCVALAERKAVLRAHHPARPESSLVLR